MKKRETKAEAQRRSDRIAAECSGMQDEYYIKYDLKTTPDQAAAAIGITSEEMRRHLSGECYNPDVSVKLVNLYITMRRSR